MTYDDIARRLGVRICRGCSISRRRHLRGDAPRGGNTIHWATTRLTRRGLAKFLVAAAELWLYNDRAQPPRWRVIYETTVWATRHSRAWHIALPTAFYAERRRVARKAMRGYPIHREYPRAYHWAHRQARENEQ